MKKALTNPWTDDEVKIDDGLWHGPNPRDNGIQPVRKGQVKGDAVTVDRPEDEETVTEK
jgi:hypothetical protein